MKKSFCFTLGLCFFFSSVFAKEENLASENTDNKTNCILLGSNPSFIVRNRASNFQAPLSLHLKANSSISNMKILNVRPMLGNAHVISFTPLLSSKRSNEIQPKKRQVCYPKKIVNEWISQIKQNLKAEYVEPNFLIFPSQIEKIRYEPSDSKNDYSIEHAQWNLHTPPYGINVQNGWEVTKGKSDIVIAVLDSGYLPHDALEKNILPGIIFNNMGKISKGSLPSCIPGQDGVENNIKLCDGYNHGNHVMGIISANGAFAYEKRIHGVAPNIKILPINVFSKITDEAICAENKVPAPCLSAYNEDIQNALNWLAGQKIENLHLPKETIVGVNMSLGGGGFCGWFMQESLNRLIDKKISIVIAAGNSNIDAFFTTPANCEGVITVAATDNMGLRGFAQKNGKRFYYSNYGKTVKVAAPGGSFLEENQEGGIYSLNDKGYYYLIGTSMAAPHVSGLIALLYSVDPTLTPQKALNIIQETATPFPISENPKANCIGKKSCGAGIINVGAALQRARSQLSN